ncbi:MAG: CusA/CzcA family heavy metal efflux RND transporter [Candidatus Omnitrophica bacterium]|nr:CusA/CzcA family heavy metal efflux RND transporter [Candidatus Omnitrophota bacterium]
MVEKIIKVCVRNRTVVIGLFIFMALAGFNAMKQVPIDAIPDIGEMQVIVYADWPGRSPRDIEDQVIYPLTTGLMGTPGVKVVRSTSAFGFGLVNMIFEEGTDFYWARTRVLERLDQAKRSIPEDVVVALGPDATAVGQIFWYTVEGDGYDLEKLRSLQDWYVRYQLASVEGVSEVASIGGFVRQYQIDVDPNKLIANDVSLHEVMRSVQASNLDVGAKVFEEGGMEFIVRGVGFITGTKDIEDIVIKAKNGTPVYVKNIAKVTMGPDFRRGALDKEGKEVTGGVVIMRYGENPLEVISRIKSKIKEIESGLPPGVRIVPFYDRTGLILRTINTLRTTLLQEIIITVLVISVFLLHFLGSLAISVVLPLGILIAFLLMAMSGIDANIMSLGGIAIAIGVMVDSACVMVENIYTSILVRQERSGDKGVSDAERLDACEEGAREVGKPILVALLTTIIGFLPIFVLTGQAGKLFRPLAFTKTFTMVGAALITLMLLPTLAYYSLKGRLSPPEKNRTTEILKSIYRPVIKWGVNNKKVVIAVAVFLVVVGTFCGMNVKQEFMPPLNEGDLLFMPVLLPGASLTQVMDVMKRQDVIIKEGFPDEVEWVVGKLGRAETATDPAPVTMIETIIHLKDKSKWRKGMTREKLVRLIEEKTMMPGVSPIMTQPIRNRIDMLATGIQTPVGIKVFGPDIDRSVEIASELERIVSGVDGAVNPYAERVSNRPYFEIIIDREKAARYGVKVDDVQDIIMTAVGGMNLTWVIDGRERYPVRVRYLRELRDDPVSLERVLVCTADGKHIPLAQLAELKKTSGPAMINSENTQSYVRVFINVDPEKTGLVDFVENAKRAVKHRVDNGGLVIPTGYFISWSGQFESEMQARQRLVPSFVLALAVILFILYISFRKLSSLLLLFSGIPVSLMGGVILLFVAGFKFSTAVWVGFIALFGVATDNAVVLLSVLDDLFNKEKPGTREGIRALVEKGALMRIRPAIMTVATTILALMAIMFSSGTGSEIMKPMAIPTIGGLVTATLSNMVLVPVLYSWIKERALAVAGKA